MLRKIKMFIFGVSWVLGGLAFYIGPGEWSEIPYHHEIGIGLALLGALFLAALLFRSAMRALQTLFITAIAGGFLYVAFLEPIADWGWQNLLFAGLGLLFVINIPIAATGGYDFAEPARNKSLSREVAEDAGKKGIKEFFED